MEERPYTYVVAFCSADAKTTPSPLVLEKGREALTKYALTGLSDHESLMKKAHQLRADVDAVLVGSQTIITDNSELTVRFGIEGKNPLRVIPASKGGIPLGAKVLDTSKAKTLIAVSKKAPVETIRNIQAKGAEVVVIGEEAVDMRQLMEELYRRGIKTLLVEGGARIRWTFFSQGLADEFWLMISPTIWGEAIEITKGGGFIEPEDILKLELKKYYVIGNLVCIEYKVLNK